MYRLIIALLMFLFVVSPGYSQSFRDNNNMLLGKVESDGTIRNANNMRLGKIFDDGTTCYLVRLNPMARFAMPITCALARYSMMEPSGIATI